MMKKIGNINISGNEESEKAINYVDYSNEDLISDTRGRSFYLELLCNN